MSKLQVEKCREISIFKLKEWGYLENEWNQHGGIKWTDERGDENKISFYIDLCDKNGMYIELNYKTKGYWEKEWTDIKYKIPIVTTPCNYGGKRYWFICPIHNNGKYCGKRVAKLYKGGNCNYFACRHCYDLTYQSRIDGYAYSDKQLDKLGMSIKRWYYNGKPTRKHLRYNRISNSINKSWQSFLKKFNLE